MKQIPQLPLAGRGARLGAALIDSLIFYGSLIPGIAIINGVGSEIGKGFGIALVVIAFLSLLIVQATFLIKRGQSLGKMVVGIRIVKVSDESVPGFVKVFVLRMFVPILIECIPVVGAILALADALFIFRDDRRCLHDLVAETKVTVAAFAVQSDSQHRNEQDGGVASTRPAAATRNAPAQETSSSATAERSSNNAYAAALAEIEEGRLDKGVWARSFADSGGDESKAKASYIKARAASIKDALVWQDTQPPGAEDAGAKATDEGQAASVRPAPVATHLSPLLILAGLLAILVVVGVVGIAAMLNKEYTKRQAVAASPVQAPAQVNPFSDPNFGKTAPPAQTSTKEPSWSGGFFDETQWTVGEIETHARQFPQLNDPRAWAAVLAWQESNMRVDKNPANVALHQAVGTVLDGLKDNKGVCQPGRVEIVSAAQASNSIPAGTPLTLIDCDR